MVSGQQIKAARALLRWSGEALAERAGQSVLDVARLELGRGGMGLDLPRFAIGEAIEAAGVEILDHGQPGVRLRKADG